MIRVVESHADWVHNKHWRKVFHGQNGKVVGPYEFILYTNAGFYNSYPVMDVKYIVRRNGKSFSKTVYENGHAILTITYSGSRTPVKTVFV